MSKGNVNSKEKKKKRTIKRVKKKKIITNLGEIRHGFKKKMKQITKKKLKDKP